MKETKSLIIEQIEWQYQKSTEATSTRQPARNKTGIKWMKVRCKNCNHEWKTKDSYEIGSFYEVANELILDCPRCSTTHTIQRKVLD